MTKDEGPRTRDQGTKTSDHKCQDRSGHTLATEASHSSSSNSGPQGQRPQHLGWADRQKYGYNSEILYEPFL